MTETEYFSPQEIEQRGATDILWGAVIVGQGGRAHQHNEQCDVMRKGEGIGRNTALESGIYIEERRQHPNFPWLAAAEQGVEIVTLSSAAMELERPPALEKATGHLRTVWADKMMRLHEDAADRLIVTSLGELQPDGTYHVVRDLTASEAEQLMAQTGASRIGEYTSSDISGMLLWALRVSELDGGVPPRITADGLNFVIVPGDRMRTIVEDVRAEMAGLDGTSYGSPASEPSEKGKQARQPGKGGGNPQHGARR